MEISRRDAMVVAVGLATVASAPVAIADQHPQTSKQLTRIAFGSCADQKKPQPIWDAVLEVKPDLFIFLGDNVYIDSRDINDFPKAYALLEAKPGFRKLRDTVPILAIWDDHDFGNDDQDKNWPLKAQSKEIFLNFWREPKDSLRWQRDGVYAAHIFGPAGQQVQIILPDLRTNKTPNLKRDLGPLSYKDWAKQLESAGKPVFGPYDRDFDQSSTQLGDAQWQWLEAQLKMPADVRIFASSLQVLADFPGWEEWVNYAQDHARLIDTIRRTRANGLFFISGDTHYAEFSKLDVNVPYPLWDCTSSGLTEVWPVLPPNGRRVGAAYRDQNFGLIEIDWSGAAPQVRVSIHDVKGRRQLSQVLNMAELRV